MGHGHPINVRAIDAIISGFVTDCGDAKMDTLQCYRCNRSAKQTRIWNTTVRLDSATGTVAYALIFHCSEHRPADRVDLEGQTRQTNRTYGLSDEWLKATGKSELGGPNWPKP